VSAPPEVLAIIGVRSGSRGLPDKNVLPLAGHPLLAWIVSAARRAQRVTRVIVSTDSEEYAEVARAYGAETPFLRPAALASDTATDVRYVAHALDLLEESEGYVPEIVLRLLATVPTQTPEDIDAAVDLLLEDVGATSAVVVAAARQHPEKAMRIVEVDGRRRLAPYLEGRTGVEPGARQAYVPAYVRANVVATRPAVVRGTGTLTGDAPTCYIVDGDRIVDIDAAIDLELAALIIERHQDTLPSPEWALVSERAEDLKGPRPPEEERS
jgi:CMP-N,N'-diacetyllegionaminic acid synthase